MVYVDLITGFLGAGKTTFLHKYLHFLQKKGLRPRIIENEFGAVSVDTQLLKDEDCEIDDLAGLCMCCVGKDAFIRLLKESAAKNCNRILVEPSGIYDVDEFFEVMSLPEIAAVCQIGSIITIADPYGMEYLSEEARYLLFAQILASGMVLLSKTTDISDTQLQDSLDNLDELMKEKGCECGIPADVMTKSWDELTDDDFEEIMDAGYSRFVHDRELFRHDETFQSAAFLAHCSDQEDLVNRIQTIFDSPSCGRVYRIKGFAKSKDGICYEVNCTTDTISVRKTDPTRGLLVVIGQQIREREIKEQLL